MSRDLKKAKIYMRKDLEKAEKLDLQIVNTDRTSTETILNHIDKQEQDINRLLELCMFALLPKSIYNHELSINTKEDFKNIIKNNLNEDTHTIRNKIVKCWNGK